MPARPTSSRRSTHQPAPTRPRTPLPGTPLRGPLGRVALENGMLLFRASQAGLSVVAEKANFSASVGSIDGPYSLAGSAPLNGTPLRLDLAVGAKAASGHIAEVALEAGGGKPSFQGAPSEIRAEAQAVGPASR